MSPRHRILTIRLTEKLTKNPEYARNLGVEIINKNKKEAENDENRN